MSSSSRDGSDLTFPTYPVNRENLDRHLTSRLRVMLARVVVGGFSRSRREEMWSRSWMVPRARARVTYGAACITPAASAAIAIAAVFSEVKIYIANSRRPHLLDSPPPHPSKNRLVTLVTFRGHAWYPDHKFHWQLCSSRKLSRPSPTTLLRRANARTCTHRVV